MTKSELIAWTAAQTGFSQADSKAVIDGFIEGIRGDLLEGARIQIAGLGIFSVKDTKARVGRNPSTGETINVPAGRKIVFKPAADLKAAI